MNEKMKDNGRMLKGIAKEFVYPFFIEIYPDFIKGDVKADYYFKEPDFPFLQLVTEGIEQEDDV